MTGVPGRVAALLGATLCAAACRSVAPAPQASEPVCIACVAGGDWIAEQHVTNVLRREGIDAGVEGSVLWGVFVAPEDEKPAIEILSREAAHGEHGIMMNHPVATTAPWPEWEELPLRGSYADLLGRPDLSVEVRALLADARVAESLDDFPYVVRIRVRPRQYLGSDGETRTGYDAELEMGADAEAAAGSHMLLFQVLSGGKDVHYQGGSRWGGLKAPEQ